MSAARAARVRRLALVAAASLLALAHCRDAGGSGPRPEGFVEVRGKRIAVEIADGREEQSKGLGGRDALAWDRGMYFPYDRPDFYGFWMKDMRFPIDIVFVRAGRIVDLHPQVPFEPGGNGPTIRPRELADGVLEVPAGYAAAQGWRVGDRLELTRVSAEGPDR